MKIKVASMTLNSVNDAPTKGSKDDVNKNTEHKREFFKERLKVAGDIQTAEVEILRCHKKILLSPKMRSLFSGNFANACRPP